MKTRSCRHPRHSRVTKSPSVAGLLRLLALVLLLVLLGACASSQVDDGENQSNSRKAAESNTSLGLEYMNRGQFEIALGKLKKAVREDPDYAPGHTVLAVLYERIGESELAGKHYKKAYEADPDNGDVNNNYGVFLCQHGEEALAIEHLLRSLDDPFYGSPAVALTNAGSCALGVGDVSQADDFLRRALKIDPGFPDALLTMARLSFEQQNYLGARAFIQRFEAAATHGPESLLLAYKIENASRDTRAANKYRITLETNYPGSNQAEEARRISGK